MKRERDPRLDELIEYVQNLDAEEILDDLGLSYTSQGKNVSEGWIGIQCVFPDCDDTSNHLGINLQS